MATELGKAYVQIVPSADGIEGSISRLLGGEVDEAGKSAGSKLGGAIKTGLGVAAGAVATASSAMVAFGKTAVDAGMSFDSSMSQVAATMGVSIDQIQDLREFAMDMGAKTAFSATQAADALNYMALAGYDADTSMAMLPNVLNLAAAGGIELASASDMITDAQSALGLSLEETSDMVDQMAAAASKSNTSVAQLGDAFLTIGATARNVSGGTQELATMLGVLADNGIKGTEGGTHLRNILLSLQDAAVDGAVDFGDFAVSVYDADGNMRSMVDIVEDMQEGMDGMSQASKDALISGVFNKTDLASVNALLGTSTERFAELSSAIDDSAGAAEQMADTQLDNLAGDVTLFQSALEGAQIVVSDQLTPTLREFVQFGTDGLTRITDAFSEGGLSGAMGALGEVLSDGLNMVIEAAPDMIEAGMELLGALGQGLLDNLPAITDAALEIVIMLVQGLVDSLPMIVEAALQIILQLALGLADALPELVPTIVEVIMKIVEILTEPEMLMNLIDAALQIIIALADGIIQAIPELLKSVPVIIMNLVTALIELAPQLAKSALQLITTLASSLVEMGVKLADAAAELFATIKDTFKERIENAKEWGRDLVQNFIDGLKQKWNDLKDAVSGLGQTIKNFIGFSEPKEGPLSNFHTYAPDMMELFAQGIADNEDIVKAQIDRSFDFSDSFSDNDSLQYSLPIRSNISSVNAIQPANNAIMEALASAVNVTVPVYIGNERLDEYVASVNRRINYKTGGR